MRAYLITCFVTRKSYIGITGRSLSQRWREHVYNSSKRPNQSALYCAIAKYGAGSFTITELCSARSKADIVAIEKVLIEQWGTLAPAGYNLTFGGEGRFGYKPSAESVERSAAKHRGKPCHPNTRRVSKEFHSGRKRTPETKARIAAAKKGVKRSEETKAKIAAYWAERRASGDFKTANAYEHSRKAASAQIAKIPFPLSSHIARCFKPSLVSVG